MVEALEEDEQIRREIRLSVLESLMRASADLIYSKGLYNGSGRHGHETLVVWSRGRRRPTVCRGLLRGGVALPSVSGGRFWRENAVESLAPSRSALSPPLCYNITLPGLDLCTEVLIDAIGPEKSWRIF